MRLNGIELVAFIRLPFTGLGPKPADGAVMTVNGGNQCSSRNSANSSPTRPLPDAVAAKDDLIVNASVTYAPLGVWKDFHWTCTVTSFAPLVQDRLE